jgi:DNA invertase Pin-like site-specific DNA recombinase
MPLPPSSLRRALSDHRPGRGKLYAPEVQRAVVDFAQGRRDDGASWKEIATELGLRFETVRRWCLSGTSARPLKRVEVVDDVRASGSGLSVLCPSGHRLEGLTVGDAIAVLRALA